MYRFVKYVLILMNYLHYFSNANNKNHFSRFFTAYHVVISTSVCGENRNKLVCVTPFPLLHTKICSVKFHKSYNVKIHFTWKKAINIKK